MPSSCLLEPIPGLRVDEQHGSAVAKSEQQMKALAWHGKGDIRCEEVPDPKIEHPRDAIIKVTGVCDLRFRPAYLRRHHSRHEKGRRARPREYG
jgi:hypothetical protein